MILKNVKSTTNTERIGNMPKSLKKLGLPNNQPTEAADKVGPNIMGNTISPIFSNPCSEVPLVFPEEAKPVLEART